MTLFVHIGPHKTASTLGQMLFATANDSGTCVYLPIGRASQGRPDQVHHPVAEAIRTPHTSEARALLAGIESCLARAQAAGQSVLISSEMFPTVAALYLPLRDIAARQGHDLRMIFVCRDPVARLNSMYTQSIKTRRFDGPIAAFVAVALTSGQRDERLRPCTVLRPRFTALGARFDLMPYDASGMEPLFRQLCAQIGLAVAATTPNQPDRINTGPSAAAIRLLREGVVPPDTPRLFKMLQTADLALAQPAYFGMTPELATQIRTTLADDLTALGSTPMLLGQYQDEVAADASHPTLNDGSNLADYEGYCRFVLDLARQWAGQ